MSTSSMMCPVAVWSEYLHIGEWPLKSHVDYVDVSWQILFYVLFARCWIVDVVYDIIFT